MRGVILPGQARGEIEEFDRPEPGACQVLVETKASGLCGSDLRAVYHGHRGSDPNERYHNVIAGHEPAGRIEAVGPGVEGFGPGDRIVYLGEGGPVTFEPTPFAHAVDTARFLDLRDTRDGAAPRTPRPQRSAPRRDGDARLLAFGDEAGYEAFDAGRTGKVVISWEEDA